MLNSEQKKALKELKAAEEAALEVIKTVPYNILHSSRLLESAKDYIKVAFSLAKEAVRSPEYK
jgi:hypothetical protein